MISLTKPVLTERELQIITLTAEGLTAKEVANKLSISLKTVEIHRHNAIKKTGASNMIGLINYLYKNNIFKCK